MARIKAGLRVLYKDNKNPWRVGIVAHGSAAIDEQGLKIPIIPIEFATMDPNDIPYEYHIDINDIFTDSQPLQDWVKKYKEFYMTKEEYIQFIESEDFDKKTEVAYVTDGEYIYYPISTYTPSWIMKQPFDYIVRND